jgi:hypothetical protein
MMIDEVKDYGDRIVFEIPINDFIFFSAFQDSSKCEYRKWKPAIARLGSAGMKEDDHLLFLAV